MLYTLDGSSVNLIPKMKNIIELKIAKLKLWNKSKTNFFRLSYGRVRNFPVLP